ncbi:MAG TPA: MFS transporter [Vicinamibacterales bacterium]|jgi:benzoate transport
MTTDPRDVIAYSPMSRLQILVIAITVGLNALDGFDVLSISFASPGIATEWGIDRAALGIVLSMELIGMAIGSVFLGGVADKIGRRPTILGCLVVMAVGMLMATTVKGLVDLSIWRVVTGLGIGGMLAAINAVAAEFSSTRRRHLSVSVMSIGYPVGAVLGGIVAARLLRGNDWRSVFYFGASVTAALIPVVFFYMPESIHWLARKQPNGALEKINRALARMGHVAAAALPAIPADLRKKSVADIFAPALLASTVLVTLAYFFHITTFYFIVKWVPKIVADFGFPASSAAGVLVWANVGGALGGSVFGILTQRYGVKALTIGVMLLSTVMVALFGRTPADLDRLSLICAVAGFCTNAGIVGLYAIIAQAFPTHVRAFGTGFTVGVGRGGSVLAPIIAGFLFAAGYSLPAVALLLALGSLFAAGMLLMLKLESDQPQAPREERRTAPTHVPAPSRVQ